MKKTTKQADQTVSESRPFGIFQEVFNKHGIMKRVKTSATDDVRCPDCNCGGEYLAPCDDGSYFCNECGNSFDGNSVDDGYIDPVGAMVDIKAVLHRIGVMTLHSYDLVQAQTPESTRVLSMLAEIDLLSKDGLKRIQQTGLEL